MLSRKIKKKSVVPRWQPYVFIAPFFIIYIAFSLFPVLYSFVISLYQWDGIGEKAYIGFQNYMTLFTKDNLFFKSVGNTFLIMSVPLPVLVIGGTMLASLINSKFVRGKRLFQTINFLPYLTAPVAVGILFGLMFDQQNGVVNEALKSMGLLNEGLYWLKDGNLARIVVMIMCTWKYMGYYMVLLLAGITSISSDIYEAARIDGAGMVTTFFPDHPAADEKYPDLCHHPGHDRKPATGRGPDDPINRLDQRRAVGGSGWPRQKQPDHDVVYV